MPVTLKYIILFLMAAFAVGGANGQEKAPAPMRAEVVDGDTLFFQELPDVYVFAPRVFKNKFDEYRYRRLVKNVKAVYPFARLAGMKFEEYSVMLASMDDESERRKAMREAEQELREEFEDELRRFTFSQGLILIKLVDRETRHSSYDLVKDFRGNLSAMFWQSLGKLFGYNLRTKYDPYGEDKTIEEIVRMIEAGAI